MAGREHWQHTLARNGESGAISQDTAGALRTQPDAAHKRRKRLPRPGRHEPYSKTAFRTPCLKPPRLKDIPPLSGVGKSQIKAQAISFPPGLTRTKHKDSACFSSLLYHTASFIAILLSREISPISSARPNAWKGLPTPMRSVIIGKKRWVCRLMWPAYSTYVT